MSRYKTSNGRWIDEVPAFAATETAKLKGLAKFAQTWMRSDEGAIWYVDCLSDEYILRCGAKKVRVPQGHFLVTAEAGHA